MNTKVKQITDANGNTISIEASFPLLTRVTDSKGWIAYSPHFKTFGYSKESEEKAVEDFDRAIHLFFDIHSKRGTIEKALICFGWRKIENTFRKPKLFNRPSVRRDDMPKVQDHYLEVA